MSFAGALLGHGAVLVWNDVANEGRQQFYEWHDKEHMPERLSLPGFRRGRRFAKPGHSPEWLTMYEADDLSVVTSPEYLARLNAPTPGTVDALRYFLNTSRAVCRVVHSIGSSTGGHVLAMRVSVPGDRSEAMCRYLCADAFPRVILLTGIVACHLLAADQSASFINTAESSTRQFDVPSWILLCEATNPGAAEGVEHAAVRRSVLDPAVRGDESRCGRAGQGRARRCGAAGVGHRRAQRRRRIRPGDLPTVVARGRSTALVTLPIGGGS